MALLLAQSMLSPQGGYVNPCVTAALRSVDTAWIGWPAGQADIGVAPALSLLSGHSTQHPQARAGMLLRSYMDDYYYRVHVRPNVIDLGNLVSPQIRTVEVWNAWPDQTLNLSSVDAANASGIIATPPAALPMAFAPLQSRTWQLSIDIEGASDIDATLTWNFTSTTAALGITGQRVTAWTFVPNWDTGVAERLSWKTRIFQSPSAAEQRSSVRLSPRATFEFTPLVYARERSLFDNMLFDAGSRIFALPIWHDIEWLTTAVAAGALHIPVSAGVRDFHADGLAILRAVDDAFAYEVVEIDSLDATGLALKHATLGAWPVGSRLYPARKARLTQQPTASRLTDNLWNAPVQFQLAESYDFAPAAPTAMYRGVPVIEDRPVENDDLPTGWDRVTTDLDNDTGLPSSIDTADIGFTKPAHAWLVQGRDEHARLRGLLYYFAGRREIAWRPTFAQDFTPVANIGAGSATIDVGFVGYTRFAQGRTGKRDIRIELAQGAPIYRRITASIEVDAQTERLSLDAAVGVDLAIADIARISYMELVRGNSDDVEIQHGNAPAGDYGDTSMNLTFRALRDDLELPA